MNEGIVIPVSFFIFVAVIWYVYLTTRNKERMAMIEKGADASLFRTRPSQTLNGINYFTLKTGLFFIGIGLGVIIGNIIDVYTSLEEATAYISMIFLFGGLGLVAGYWLQEKKSKNSLNS